ncbi:hypothetical protein HN371_14630 [Candidatus Poribacteria bacterium]|jgi:hypothetical protein|nr:hypothetical protein [Candidatus Poribacteria bacterium]MBT5712225.1 hypothetical protein [Candidatus Poribacteria bacterium]MBT7099810.1 hypothetical protein [Candidatus Poribacteria bacterium]MBT7806969.1 hypothetical protein [Candidatus Poribacteria bacterium]
MPFPIFIITIVGILSVFGSPVAITWMILNAKRKSVGASSEEFAALQSQMDDLRQQMEATHADITLMLDDIERKSLPRDSSD